MSILLQTQTSALIEYDYTNISELIYNCVIDVHNKLIINPPITVYGKQAVQRRSIGFFSNESIGYRYSGQIACSQPMTDNLNQLINIVNNHLNANFNGILVNYYANGEEYIGAHSDNEKELSNIGVFALSINDQPRTFRIRNKSNNSIVLDIPTKSYYGLLMTGNFQKEFKHEIPISKKIITCRYSFTFRHHNE